MHSKRSVEAKSAPAIGRVATVLVCFSLTAAAEIAAQGPPPETEHIGRLIAAIQTSVAQNPPAGESANPPAAPDPTSPSTVLYGVVDELDALLAARGTGTLTPAAKRQVARARDAVLRSLASYGAAPSPGAALRSLADAARSLRAAAAPPHGPRRELERLAHDLAGAARDVADALLRLATSAGARPQVLAQTQRLITLGELAILDGQYAVAIVHFGGAADFAANVGIVFDIDRFEQNLRDALDGQTIGHAYTIARNGQLYSQDHDGQARTTEDPPAAPQSAYKDIYVASMSKTLTAVGLLKALAAAGISVDSAMAPYLPGTWTQGPNVENITFRHLLTHRSGLDQAQISGGTMEGQSFATLADIIATGTAGILQFSNAVYTNANFSLMRVLIPRITAAPGVIANYTNIWPEDLVYAAMYADYLRAEVLDPAGVDAPLCAPDESASARTFGYSFSEPDQPGSDYGDWSLFCGATGWYLSAVELGGFLASLRYTDDVVDEPTRDLMDSGFLGWLNPATFAGYVGGAFGDYRAHGGDYVEFTGCAMQYPIHVEATLVINSTGGDLGGHACAVLRDAFDDAWVAQ